MRVLSITNNEQLTIKHFSKPQSVTLVNIQTNPQNGRILSAFISTEF